MRVVAAALRPLPSPPITADRIALTETGNAASARMPGLHGLGAAPASLGEVLTRDINLAAA